MSSTQVILLERVEKLGELGETVTVKPGYARNYLLPQKKALRANKENLAYFEAQRKSIEAENEKKRKEAEKAAKNIDGLNVVLIRQASEGGQLFGSVASRDIAEAVAKSSKEKVAKSMVDLNQNIKNLGLFPVEIVLHPEVRVTVTINIARSSEEAEIQKKTGVSIIDAANLSAQKPVEEEQEEASSEEAQEENAA